MSERPRNPEPEIAVVALPLNQHQLQFWSATELAPLQMKRELIVLFHFAVIDPIRFEQALARVIEEEPMVRASLVEGPDGPAVLPGAAPAASTFDVVVSSDGASWKELLAGWLDTPLDPRSSLARVRLLRQPDQSSLLAMKIDHLVSDGWSIRLFVDRLHSAYADPGRIMERGDFGVFLRYEQGYLRSRRYRQDRSYWQPKLSRAIQPTDFYGHSLSVPTLPSIRTRTSLGTERTATLRDRSRSLANGSLQLGLFSVLAAALVILIQRLGDQEWVSIGAPFANRRDASMQSVFGLVMQLGVLRLRIEPTDTLRSIVAKVESETVETRAHINYTVPNPECRNFDVVFNFHDITYPLFDGSPPIEEWLHSANDNVPLAIHVRTADAADIRLEFDHAEELRLGGWRIAQFQNDYFEVLDSILQTPDATIRDLRPSIESDGLVPVAAGAIQELPDRTLSELFEARAKAQATMPAVYDRNRTYTFGKLNALAVQFSHRLRMAGVRPGMAIGIRLPRSVESIVAILGVLKCGAIWVPVDPDYPSDWTAKIEADAGVTHVVVGRTATSPRSSTRSFEPISMPLDIGELDRLPPEEVSPPLNGGDPDLAAFLFYTSGSTGRPKGVAGTHRSAINRIRWMWRVHPFEPKEVVAHKTSPSFVDSIWEVFGGLLAGHAVLVVPQEIAGNLDQFVSLIAAHAVNRLIVVPSLLQALLDRIPDLGSRLPFVTRWFVTGESFHPALAKRATKAMPNTNFFNLYGATEFIDAACEAVDPRFEDLAVVPIGTPVDNMSLYILDDDLQPVTVGGRGELYVAGIGVSDGYWGAAKSPGAERYIASAVGRLFRTGDAARRLPSGCIELLGRVDHLLKVRGYRIEPQEIEYHLSQHPAVRRSSVVSAGGDSTVLVAFVEERSRIDPQVLQYYLRERIPGWMVPAIRPIVELPQTPSGKIDRRELSRRGLDDSLPPIRGKSNSEPGGVRTATESELRQIWRGLLGIENIGRNDNFFDLGGHSLLALRLTAEIEQRFGLSIPVSAVFESPTIALFSTNHLGSRDEASGSLVLLKRGEDLPPLFGVPPAGSTVSGFTRLCSHLAPEWPVYAFQPRGIEDREQPHRTIRSMARAYVREMRSVQPRGPYHLIGRCFGGYVVFEMARQLRSTGEHVALLALVDSQEAPLGARKRRELRGLRRLLVYYPNRLRHYIRRGGLTFRLRMKILVELRNALNVTLVGIGAPQSPTSRRLRRLQRLGYLHTRAYRSYAAVPYDGMVTMFLADGDPQSEADRLNWKTLAPTIESIRIACRHRELLQEPHVRLVAASLVERLPRSAAFPIVTTTSASSR